MKKIVFGLVLLVSSLVLVSCVVSDGGPTTPSINVTPPSVTLEKNKSQIFKAELSDKSSTNFTWSANAGTLSATTGSSVNYSAPGTVGDYRITVDSVDASAARTVNVKVVDQVSVVVTPSAATVAPGDNIVLNASLDSNKDSTFTWETTGGTIAPTTGKTATFTAPSGPGIYQVIVKSPDASKDGTANITVAPAQTATDTPDNPILADLSIPAGGKQTYIIDAASGIFAGDQYMTIELGTSSKVKLSVFDASRNLVGVSDDPKFFTSGSSSSSLETQDISNSPICLGPCVNIVNADGSSERYYVQIESDTSATYDLYAYSNLYNDSTEPGGATDCEVTSFPAGQAERFALEALGDIDCILSDGAENRVVLDTVALTALAVKADIYDGTSLIATLNAGPGVDNDTFSIVGPAKNLRVLVRSSDGRAGPSKNSEYKITFNTP